MDDTRYRRKEQSAAKKRIETEGDDSNVPDAAATQKMLTLYCQCLQHTLHVSDFLFSVNLLDQLFSSHTRLCATIEIQEQVTALIQRCGMERSISSVMRRIWLAYVAKSGILTGQFARCAPASCAPHSGTSMLI